MSAVMDRPFVLSCREVSETELGVYRRILDGARWKVAAGREYQTADVTEHVPGTLRAFFVKLPPGGSMHWHTDTGDCQTDHIVMTTNPGCENAWLDDAGREQVTHMLPGHRYSVDRTVWHSACNKGDADRVHLLVEY